MAHVISLWMKILTMYMWSIRRGENHLYPYFVTKWKVKEKKQCNQWGEDELAGAADTLQIGHQFFSRSHSCTQTTWNLCSHCRPPISSPTTYSSCILSECIQIRFCNKIRAQLQCTDGEFFLHHRAIRNYVPTVKIYTKPLHVPFMRKEKRNAIPNAYSLS